MPERLRGEVLTGFGRRSFSVSGPDAWNSLPLDLRGIAVASTFKRRLKAVLFTRAYGVSTTGSPSLPTVELYDITIDLVFLPF